jgi:hypothetical protein
MRIKEIRSVLLSIFVWPRWISLRVFDFLKPVERQNLGSPLSHTCNELIFGCFDSKVVDSSEISAEPISLFIGSFMRDVNERSSTLKL